MRWVFLLFVFLFLFSFVSAGSETRVDFIISDGEESVNVYSGISFFDLTWSYVLVVLIVFVAVFTLVKFKKKRFVHSKSKKSLKRKLKKK